MYMFDKVIYSIFISDGFVLAKEGVLCVGERNQLWSFGNLTFEYNSLEYCAALVSTWSSICSTSFFYSKSYGLCQCEKISGGCERRLSNHVIQSNDGNEYQLVDGIYFCI